MTPFDYLNSINTNKQNLDISDYVPFMINRGLSYFKDTILLANEMNQYADTDHQLQFDFYRHAIKPKKRFSKWHKADKVTKDIEVIQKSYNYSREKAEQVKDILTKKQLKELHTIWNTIKS